MQNVYINVSSNASTALTGIYEMNVAKSAVVVNVKVQVNNGLVIYYKVSTKVQFAGVRIEAFHYSQKSCLKYSQSAIKCMILSGPFGVVIENTVFANLRNSSALHCYSSENNAHNDTTQILSYLQIINVTVMHNMGFGYLKMFHIMLGEFEPLQSSASNFIKNVESIAGFTDVLRFYNCSFVRNTNIETMIHVEPLSYSKQGCLQEDRSTFYNNTDVCFIKVNKNYAITRNLVTSVFLTNLTVSSNIQQYHSNDLILIMNAYVLFSNNVFTQNCNKYKSVLKLWSSVIYFIKNNRFIKNKARYVLIGQIGSILYLDGFATVRIVDNVAYKVILQEDTLDISGMPTCPLQFFNNERIIEIDDLHGISCTILLLNNTEMISKSLPNQLFPFTNINCAWFEDSVFKQTNASTVYHKTIKFNNKVINKTSERFVPLSVCQCSQNSSYNCYDANLGSVFPGQTLHIQLIIPHQWSTSSSTIIVANTNDDDCSIVDRYQLSQSHPINHGCNNYSYNIWRNGRYVTECKLFVGLSEIPEMFYVQMKPCPVGSTLESDKESCHCDPLLLNNDILSITSCNLDDETILRPANSWISADTNNSSHTYKVSPQCPFDYCLPHSSNLNLTNPDSQCQFKRSGVLCGEC